MSGPNGQPIAKGVRVRRRLHLGRGESAEALDTVAVEEPLEIRVDGETVAVTMRTPGADAELALGFLLAEGIIAGPDDVGSVSHCGRPGDESYGNVLDVRSAAGAPIDVERVLEGRRWSMTVGACGVCGRKSIDGLLARCGAVERDTRLPAPVVAACVAHLTDAQPIFARTGGLHAAALYSAGGDLLTAAEDVGRHNAVDKVIGTLLRQGALGATGAGAPVLLTVSGRTSFEIIQKAAAAGVPLVASVSAPSSLAVDLAERARIGLAGFVRGGDLNVYAHAWRFGVAEARPDVGAATSRFTPARE